MAKVARQVEGKKATKATPAQPKQQAPAQEKKADAAKAAAMKVGNGFEAGVSQGPLIDAQAMAKVEAHVADAVAKGARVVVGGGRLSGALGDLGDRFYQPTVLADVTPDMRAYREELFDADGRLIAELAELVAVAEDPLEMARAGKRTFCCAHCSDRPLSESFHGTPPSTSLASAAAATG